MPKINKDYNRETQRFQKAVQRFLINKFGKIQDEWQNTLITLFDNYDMLLEIKQTIKAEGLMIFDRFGVMVKHPLIKTSLELQVQILKILCEFGLTPKSSAKLTNDSGDDNDPLNEFLN
ncbi:hypothetical protein EZS27_018242 [termite gut metagenome]|uniref:Phage terminase small subunit P27 family n=1 Tax=termite gut metagenome TaxID=433724 RepID=A0A5J4RI56_9ZZZZ